MKKLIIIIVIFITKSTYSQDLNTYLSTINKKYELYTNMLKNPDIYSKYSLKNIGAMKSYLDAAKIISSVSNNNAFTFKGFNDLKGKSIYAVLEYKIDKKNFKEQWYKNLKFKNYFKKSLKIENENSVDYNNILAIYVFNKEIENLIPNDIPDILNIAQCILIDKDGFSSPSLITVSPEDMARSHFSSFNTKSKKIIETTASEIVFSVWDDGLQDNDAVSIYLDNQKLKDSLVLTVGREDIKVKIKNNIVPTVISIKVLNTGVTGDCTVASMVISPPEAKTEKFYLSGNVNEYLKIYFHLTKKK